MCLKKKHLPVYITYLTLVKLNRGCVAIYKSIVQSLANLQDIWQGMNDVRKLLGLLYQCWNTANYLQLLALKNYFLSRVSDIRLKLGHQSVAESEPVKILVSFEHLQNVHW